MPRILTPQHPLNKVAEPRFSSVPTRRWRLRARAAWCLLAGLGWLVASMPVRGHVDLNRFQSKPSASNSKRPAPCQVALYCRMHQSPLVNQGGEVRGNAPAARALVSGILGLFLYGPGERF